MVRLQFEKGRRYRCCFSFLFLAITFYSAVLTTTLGAQDLPGVKEIPDIFSNSDLLAGTNTGLIRIRKDGEKTTLWQEGRVTAIAKTAGGWFFLSSKGVLFSADLRKFENRSAGLPKKTIKLVVSEDPLSTQLVKETVNLTAIAVDPNQENRLLVSTGSEVFFSETFGRTWISLGSPSVSGGIKAAAFGPPSQNSKNSSVWVSTAIKGVFTRDLDAKNSWASASGGLPPVLGSNYEEVSGFAYSTSLPSRGLYAATTFTGQIFQWDSSAMKFVPRFSAGKDFSSIEAFSISHKSGAYFLSDGIITRLDSQNDGKLSAVQLKPATNILAARLKNALSDGNPAINCLALLLEEQKPNEEPLIFNECWQLPSFAAAKPESSAALSKSEQRKIAANGKRGLYLQTGFLIDSASRSKYFSFMQEKNLDTIVLDLKDDSGKLRFAPRDPLLLAMASPGALLDLDAFAAEAKARGIYLIARIVVFKDEALYRWKDGALAVRNTQDGTPWQGVKKDGQLIQEYWVDPYSPLVWQYNTAIAREVVSRSIDEIQFDYIRFPTDGENLKFIRFPYQESEMNQESALESFLRYARARLDAPLSIDIYGANGWYRSGSRTGQNAELLAEYVDVICPMFYPSHFEQEFQAQAPAELRPYRIYKLGTLRNYHIARGKALIRPWVQAFFLNVSYDRQYYNETYVANEIRGAQEGTNQGFTFWNNSGRYDDIPRLEPGVMNLAYGF